MFLYYIQVFYQGIDKVSKVIQNTPSSEDEPQDDADGEPTTEGAGGVDGAAVEGGDNPTETTEDPVAKDDDGQEEDGGDGNDKEMTDEELAARCEGLH